jgi:hypothetical protein
LVAAVDDVLTLVVDVFVICAVCGSRGDAGAANGSRGDVIIALLHDHRRRERCAECACAPTHLLELPNADTNTSLAWITRTRDRRHKQIHTHPLQQRHERTRRAPTHAIARAHVLDHTHILNIASTFAFTCSDSPVVVCPTVAAAVVAARIAPPIARCD